MKSFEEFRQDTLTEGVLRKIVKPAIRWISKGKNKRIPNEKAASLKTLAKDDISQLGKFKNPKTCELEGTFLPNPTKPYQLSGKIVSSAWSSPVIPIATRVSVLTLRFPCISV